jgi:glucosamine--fructose-6-phosphate aminotransferase (isomerizing)
MCGIFGYVGHKTNAPEMIFEGLKGLEYRGYDSWGVSVKVGKKIAMEKHVGKIGAKKITLPPSSIGIGHTRWATHGGVTMENAHPHLDCSQEIAVLHNGIIENFQELREELINAGHMFSSQTDTEVVPHLIEEYLKQDDFTTAVRKSFNRLHGLNAIVAIHTASEAIVGAKNGSPLVVGVGDKEFFIASDAVEIVKYTKDVIFIEDNQMVVLDNSLHVYSLPEGKEVKPVINTLDWTFEQSDKGKYKHFLMKEITEQPRVIRNIALNFDKEITTLSKLITEAFGTFMVFLLLQKSILIFLLVQNLVI